MGAEWPCQLGGSTSPPHRGLHGPRDVVESELENSIFSPRGTALRLCSIDAERASSVTPFMSMNSMDCSAYVGDGRHRSVQHGRLRFGTKTVNKQRYLWDVRSTQTGSF